jgi:hypothetical protein
MPIDRNCCKVTTECANTRDRVCWFWLSVSEAVGEIFVWNGNVVAQHYANGIIINKLFR